MAEILMNKYKQEVDIITSNAIDFKALRDSRGRTINETDKYFHKVNNLKIKRFMVDPVLSNENKIALLKSLDSFYSLNIEDQIISKFLENGPFLDPISILAQTEKEKYDLIHTTFYPYFNLILSLIIGNKKKIPTVCTPFFHFSNPRYLDKKMITLLKKFDLLIACTTLEKMKLLSLLKIPEDKILVIPMGVDYNLFLNRAKSKQVNFKQKFFDKNKENYSMVLFCGYKNYEKGAISILKSIPYIIKKKKKVYFVFIGPSTLAFNRELSNLRAKRDVKIINLTPENLTGYYDNKKISAFLETDIYLMPSRSDAFGIAFLEAWASNKPVIGANIGATPEVINDTFDGLLVEFDNPEDIADKVLYLLRKKRLRNKMGRFGNMKVKQLYTWDKVAKKTLESYQTLINNEDNELK